MDNTPAARAVAADEDKRGVYVTDFRQHLEALESKRDSSSDQSGDRFKVVTAVSLVSLEKTVFGQDVITSNA